MSAILFGSISTLADTSELQRESFNRAFAEHGLDWTWDRDTYRSMLATAGGEGRIAAYADRVGASVDAAAVHKTKSQTFQRLLADADLEPRPGVVETIEAARSRGLGMGLVTTTSSANVNALIDALRPAVSRDTFGVVVDADRVGEPKPDPSAYAFALEALGESARGCVAVEDNADGVRAATAAGLACVAFPNANTAGHDFPGAARQVDHLEADELVSLID